MLRIQDKGIRRAFILLAVLWTVARAFLAATLEFGNDEVYYWTFAVYPDISHFDHPGMVGWVIQLFSFNLILNSELFIRLGSLLFGVLNLGFIFLIGREIRDERTGFFAAMLYTASLYGTIITGVFILPDTPQNLFWLMGLWLFMKAFNERYQIRQRQNMLLLAFFAGGLCILSKYTGVFLIFGGLLYVVTFGRSWLKSRELYFGLLVVLLVITPILFWNIENDFISFTFQGGRVDVTQGRLRPDYFATEVLGQLFYNNPVNVVLIIMAFFALRHNRFIQPNQRWLLLFTSFPMIATFLAFALFRQTLPHWTGPSYHGLMLLAASWLSSKYPERLFPSPLRWAMGVCALVVIVGYLQIKTGFIPLPQEGYSRKLGKSDPTLDMYGWRQLGRSFNTLLKADTTAKIMPPDAPVFSYRWFPAANLDYYVAWPTGRFVYAFGPLERIHKYLWIDYELGIPSEGSDAYFITSSRDFYDPHSLYGDAFQIIMPPDSVPITRSGKTVMYQYVFRMKGLKREKLIEKLKIR